MNYWTYEQIIILLILIFIFVVLSAIVYILLKRLDAFEKRLESLLGYYHQTIATLKDYNRRITEQEHINAADKFRGKDGLYSYEVYTNRREMEQDELEQELMDRAEE